MYFGSQSLCFSVLAFSLATKAVAAGAHGEDCSINDLFKSKGKKYFGNIADPGTISESANAEILIDDFGQLTPENS